MNIKQCLLHGIPLSEANKYRKGGLGKITDFVGLTDYAGAEAQQNQAQATMKAGTDASVQMSRENIAFQKEQMNYQKEQYSDWKAVYGDLQENLGNYYNNLSGSNIASKQLANQAAEFKQAERDLTKTLAQRGISGSGMEAAARTTMAMQAANQRSTIRSSADEQAAQAKVGFLGVGLGQGSQMLGIQSQQASTVGQGFNSMASNQLAGATAQGQAKSAFSLGTLSGSFANAQTAMNVGGSMAQTAGYSDIRFKNNVVLVDRLNGVSIYTWEWNAFAKAYSVYLYEPKGVIAQELVFTHPECVALDGNGFMSVNYKLLKSIIGDF